MVILAGLTAVDRAKVSGILDLHCDQMDGNSELTGTQTQIVWSILQVDLRLFLVQKPIVES